jgi:hypothetical protein
MARRERCSRLAEAEFGGSGAYSVYALPARIANVNYR